jgi:hypothetical protein
MCTALTFGAPAHATNGISRSEVQPFAGTWTLDAVQSGAAADPETRTITVGEHWIRIEIHRPDDDHPPVLIYNLDGTRRTNPYGAGTATTEIRRDQNDIMTSTVVTVNERPVTVEERLKVTPAGDLMARVSVRVEHGYLGVQPPLATRAPNVAEGLKYFRRTG